MQERQVWSLVWEDSACRRVTKPMHRNYGVHRLYSLRAATRSHCNGNPHTAKKSSPYLRQVEKPHSQQRRPSTAKDK